MYLLLPDECDSNFAYLNHNFEVHGYFNNKMVVCVCVCVVQLLTDVRTITLALMVALVMITLVLEVLYAAVPLTTPASTVSQVTV